jgi:leucyl-tRNA synthetase
VLLLSPIVPHICHALWRELKPGTELLDQPWPEADLTVLVQDEIEMMVQVNGKLRGEIRVVKDAERATIERVALDNEQVQKFVAGYVVRRIVVVPGRLVNIVI